MWPTLFKIPWLHYPLRGYGLMLMIGFLGGTWWAARRAFKVKADPDLVVNIGLIALIASVVGARIFYVLHYWEKNFAGRGLWEVIDISAGGMEFYGGFIGALIAGVGYLWIRRVSIRIYADIVAPSLMFGMAMARIGCFLNGCCWGSPCSSALPWSVRFPFGSPAAYRQWEERRLTLPAELICVDGIGQAYPVPRDLLFLSPEEYYRARYDFWQAEEKLKEAQNSGADSNTLAGLRKDCELTKKRWNERERTISPVTSQMEKYKLTASELEELAANPENRSLHVHPAQLYASIDGMLLAWLLNAIFYRRKRHGIVFTLLLLMYPLMRIVEEIIRIDNPHDAAGLTISQFISIVIFVGGIICYLKLQRLPLRCPKAVCYVSPSAESERRQKKRKKNKQI